MREEVFQEIWRTKNFNHGHLATTDGTSIQINNYGKINTDAGPDFRFASISMDGIQWHGHIELHLKSSDWYKHRHHTDSHYDNVILHVVYQADASVVDSTGRLIPQLELNNRIEKSLATSHSGFRRVESGLPCLGLPGRLNKDLVTEWLCASARHRLQRKANEIGTFADTGADWLSIIFARVMRVLGGTVNGEEFERLAWAVPVQFLKESRVTAFKIEALLLGMAGLFKSEDIDWYGLLLREEFHKIQRYAGIESLTGLKLRKSRLHPTASPYIRLSQAARLLPILEEMATTLNTVLDPRALNQRLRAQASAYWIEHNAFGKKVATRSSYLGRDTADLILINAFIPFLLSAGKINADQALLALHKIRPENNRVVRLWDNAGYKAATAADTQGMLETGQSLCAHKRCMHCGIGKNIINQMVNQEVLPK